MKQIIKVTADASIPSVPNFIKINDEFQPLCAIAETSLREIGKLWTEELVAKAKRQAKDPETFYKQCGSK